MLILESYIKTNDTNCIFIIFRPASLQGNFDVNFLTPGSGSDSNTIKNEVSRMLEELGPQGLIANLGEGLTGKETPELVEVFVDSVHELSMIQIKQALKFSRADDFGS